MQHRPNIVAATVVVLLLCSLLRVHVLSNDAAKPNPEIGRVLFVDGPDDARVNRDNGRFHFCIFDREKNDMIFVACSGGWYGGQFKINNGSNIIADIKVPDLVGSGALIPVGDIIDETTKTELGFGQPGLHITDVRGAFK